jgi:hypothetical protein
VEKSTGAIMTSIKKLFPKVSRKTIVPYAVGIGVVWTLLKGQRRTRRNVTAPDIATYDAVRKQI